MLTSLKVQTPPHRQDELDLGGDPLGGHLCQAQLS